MSPDSGHVTRLGSGKCGLMGIILGTIYGDQTAFSL